MFSATKIMHKNFMVSYYTNHLVYSFYSIFLLESQKRDFFGYYTETI